MNYSNQGKILVRREGAMGDVICITPILRKLKEDNPECHIAVATAVPHVLFNNPYVDATLPYSPGITEYDAVIDLSWVYEINRARHVIDSYSLFVFKELLVNKSCHITRTFSDRTSIEKLILREVIDTRRLVILHAAKTWPSKTWPDYKWKKLTKALIKSGHQVAFVGSGEDFACVGRDIFVLKGRLSISEIAELMSRSKCVIGSDSGLVHVAGTTDVPIVAMYTSGKADWLAPIRHGKLGWNMALIAPDMDCYGCVADLFPPVTYCECRRKDNACVNKAITAAYVFQSFEKLIDCHQGH